MTHEQKPESAEFRTLETQVSECARNLQASLIALEDKLYVEFSEAEERGAEAQRRKDADRCHTLHSRPANVAALEDRVKELEGGGEKEWSSRTIEMLRRHVETLRTEARKRSAMARRARNRANCEEEAARMYRRALSEIVGRTGPRSYSHNRASAALAAAIREGGEHG